VDGPECQAVGLHQAGTIGAPGLLRPGPSKPEEAWWEGAIVSGGERRTVNPSCQQSLGVSHSLCRHEGGDIEIDDRDGDASFTSQFLTTREEEGLVRQCFDGGT
jgi:hypothetical protein